MSKTRKVSSLSTYKRLSPNCTKPRTAAVSRITPHCVAGNLTIEATLGLSNFVNYDSKSGASCNYAIGSDGRIGLGVEETNRSWASSSATNDQQAITIEIANNGGSPSWSMSDSAIEAWIKLSVDIAQFYGYKRVMYKEKPSSVAVGTTATEAWIKTWNAPGDAMLITLHRWYKAKDCPGHFFVCRLPELVNEINKRLGVVEPIEAAKAKEVVVPGGTMNYIVKITASALNVRKSPNINSTITKTLSKSEVKYTIVEEADGPGDTKGSVVKWGKLKSGIGWIALKYTKKV